MSLQEKLKIVQKILKEEKHISLNNEVYALFRRDVKKKNIYYAVRVVDVHIFPKYQLEIAEIKPHVDGILMKTGAKVRHLRNDYMEFPEYFCAQETALINSLERLFKALELEAGDFPDGHEMSVSLGKKYIKEVDSE